MKLNVSPRALEERVQCGFFDDFLVYTDTQFWTKTVAGSGTASLTANVSNGIMALASVAGTTNSSANIASTNAFWKITAGQPLYFEILAQYAEQNTNEANVAFGFSSVTTAVMMQDGDAGPATSYSGAIIYKQGLKTVWSCQTSNGTTQTTTVSAQTAGDTVYHRFAIEGRDVDGSNFEFTFFMDGIAMTDTTFHRPIKQTVAIASISAAKVFAVMKAGGTTATNAETLSVDYIAAYQRRALSF